MYWDEAGLEFKPPPKQITLSVHVSDELTVDITHSQFALFENLMKYNFADFRKAPSRHAAPDLPLFHSRGDRSFVATMQDRPIEFHLVLQVAQASLNLVHGWGAHANNIPTVPLFGLRAKNVTLDLKEYVARLVKFELCASSGLLVDLRQSAQTKPTHSRQESDHMLAGLKPNTVAAFGINDPDPAGSSNGEVPFSMRFTKYPAEDQAIELHLFRPCVLIHGDNLPGFVEFFVNSHDFDGKKVESSSRPRPVLLPSHIATFGNSLR